MMNGEVEGLAAGEAHAREDEGGQRGEDQHAGRAHGGHDDGVEEVVQHIVPGDVVALHVQGEGGRPAVVLPLFGVLKAEDQQLDGRVQRQEQQDQ